MLLLELTDLEKPGLPAPYPDSIPGFISVLRVARGQPCLPDTELAMPQLGQALCISSVVRGSHRARQQREREAREAEARAAEEKRRVEAAWLAIPRRIRGLQAQCMRRIRDKFVIFSYFKMPSKPAVCRARAYVALEQAKPSQCSVPLDQLAKAFGIKFKPKDWDDETLGAVCTLAVQASQLEAINVPSLLTDSEPQRASGMEQPPPKTKDGISRRRRDKAFAFNFRGSRGTETKLLGLPSLEGWTAKLRLRDEKRPISFRIHRNSRHKVSRWPS